MVEHGNHWDAYRNGNETESRVARDHLIQEYYPLVKSVAKHFGSNLPQYVDKEDLSSYGVFGLIDAIEKFEPDRGFKFETYAITRIRGAIIDEIRQFDWVPRSVRGKQRTVDNAVRSLETELHRTPTETEIAEEMGIPTEKLRELRLQIGSLYMSGFDDLIPPNAEDQSPASEMLQDHTINISDDIGEHEFIHGFREQLAVAAGDTIEREQIVLILYYSEGLTLSDVGRILGVTESRVCQIHTKAVLGLRSMLESSYLEPG